LETFRPTHVVRKTLTSKDPNPGKLFLNDCKINELFCTGINHSTLQDDAYSRAWHHRLQTCVEPVSANRNVLCHFEIFAVKKIVRLLKTPFLYL